MKNEATIREVFSDEEFVKGLFQLETPEAVQAALRQKDISLSVAEIVKVRELLLKQTESGQELSEQELESVTGGAIATICLILSASLLIGAMVGGAAVGAGTVGAAYIVNDKPNGAW